MYAVVAPDGKQHRVAVGDTIDVERVDAGPKSTLTMDPVLVVGDDGSVAATPDQLGDASVRATVVDHHKARKVTAFMYHNKTGFKRTRGHRQQRTLLRIDAIDA